MHTMREVGNAVAFLYLLEQELGVLELQQHMQVAPILQPMQVAAQQLRQKTASALVCEAKNSFDNSRCTVLSDTVRSNESSMEGLDLSDSFRTDRR